MPDRLKVTNQTKRDTLVFQFGGENDQSKAVEIAGTTLKCRSRTLAGN
jgi:hypothetical protein